VTAKRRRHNGEGSIFPRGNGYAAYVWVTTPAGRRQRKYVYGQTREVVHAKWIELTREANQGPVASSIPKLGPYLYRWLDEVVAPNLAPLTHSTYETLVRLYLAPGLGHIRLDRLRVRDLQTWLNSLVSTCQCCAQGKDARRATKDPALARCCAKGECCHSNASPRTIKDLRTVLRSALSTAMSDELIDKNVAALVKAPKIRQRKVVAWSSEEARQFLESARADGDSLYAVYVLILVLGLRKGEVLGLTWPAVDLVNRELTIGLQLQRVRRELLLRETKTDTSDAVLPLPDLCVAAIRLQAERQDTARAQAGEAWRGKPAGGGLVFTGLYGTPIDPSTTLNRRFTARCAAAGVRRLGVHDARKTCATLLVDLDVHPRIIMRILRHADLAVTMEIYAKASSASTREALRRLGEALT
jgi:integrase